MAGRRLASHLFPRRTRFDRTQISLAFPLFLGLRRVTSNDEETHPDVTLGLSFAGVFLLMMVFQKSRGQANVFQEKDSVAAASQPGNRLIHERSPYLLQHAHNPVDWYPWGEEAFEKAHRENKPIFLSVGYSTCHWCHVMERESFANPEITGS